MLIYNYTWRFIFCVLSQKTLVKDNSLSILTSSIYQMSDLDRNKIDQIVKEAEKEASSENIDDQKRYLIDQKIEVLRNLNLN